MAGEAVAHAAPIEEPLDDIEYIPWTKGIAAAAAHWGEKHFMPKMREKHGGRLPSWKCLDYFWVTNRARFYNKIQLLSALLAVGAHRLGREPMPLVASDRGLFWVEVAPGTEFEAELFEAAMDLAPWAAEGAYDLTPVLKRFVELAEEAGLSPRDIRDPPANLMRMSSANLFELENRIWFGLNLFLTRGIRSPQRSGLNPPLPV